MRLRVGRSSRVGEHRRRPRERGRGEDASARVVDVVRVAVVGRADADDASERRRPQRGDLQRVEAAPRLADHARRAHCTTAGSASHCDHLDAVVELLLQVLALEHALRVARAAQVDARARKSARGEVGVHLRVAWRRRVVLPVRDVLEDRGDGSGLAAVGEPQPRGQPRAVARRDPDVVDAVHGAQRAVSGVGHEGSSSTPAPPAARWPTPRPGPTRRSSRVVLRERERGHRNPRPSAGRAGARRDARRALRRTRVVGRRARRRRGHLPVDGQRASAVARARRPGVEHPRRSTPALPDRERRDRRGPGEPVDARAAPRLDRSSRDLTDGGDARCAHVLRPPRGRPRRRRRRGSRACGSGAAGRAELRADRARRAGAPHRRHRRLGPGAGEATDIARLPRLERAPSAPRRRAGRRAPAAARGRWGHRAARAGEGRPSPAGRPRAARLGSA